MWNPARQIGIPLDDKEKLEDTWLFLIFLEIIGDALSSLIINDKILAESKAESAMTALILNLKLLIINFKLGIIRLESWTSAVVVNSAIGSSDLASIRIWFL